MRCDFQRFAINYVKGSWCHVFAEAWLARSTIFQRRFKAETQASDLAALPLSRNPCENFVFLQSRLRFADSSRIVWFVTLREILTWYRLIRERGCVIEDNSCWNALRASRTRSKFHTNNDASMKITCDRCFYFFGASTFPDLTVFLFSFLPFPVLFLSFLYMRMCVCVCMYVYVFLQEVSTLN